MYRIAVIQNGVEMQHSGYVDAIPMYRRFKEIGKNKAEFTRFSGVNIRTLFSQGEEYLLDYDALILGTNATSDDDVYDVLREDGSKELLGKFIELGKGLLICSQKKYKRATEEAKYKEFKVVIRNGETEFQKQLQTDGQGELFYHKEEVQLRNNSKKRISTILPLHYEYEIDERPKSEKSSNGDAATVEQENYTLNQKCILCLPNKINNDIIKGHCEENTFQKHYYRDIISPKYDSAYQPIIVDKKNDADSRNLLMVAVPQKNERIVISTMALDWAGHEELLENIINYLTRGIPHTAFIHKDNYDNSEMRVLTMDAELSKVGYLGYRSIEMFMQNIAWHSLVIFSPDFSEDEVLTAWQKIKKSNPFTKAYHYRTVGQELVLVKYSNNAYIEQQKIDVLAWLNSKRGKRLWDNSFWKTFDVANLIYTIKAPSCKTILPQIVESIITEDDNGKEHYKNGGYDGVLAPTCGVLEILYRAQNVENYNITKNYLLQLYGNLSNQNKMFVLRAFAHCGDNCISDLVNGYTFDETVQLSDMIDIDICLRAETALILYENERDKNKNKGRIKDSIEELCKRQQQNGKWDNLGNTARILIFLLQYQNALHEILNDQIDIPLINEMKSHIDLGVSAIKIAYSTKYFNWENNIVTTANALLALYLYDETSGYKSKDFLKNFFEESQSASSYNALNVALQTLDKSVDEVNKKSGELFEKDITIQRLESRNSKIYRNLYIASSIAGFSLFGIISVFVLLAINYLDAFKGLLGQVFLWIPVAIGLAISPLVVYFIKILSNTSEKKSNKGAKRKDDK